MPTLQEAWENFHEGLKSALRQWTALRLAVVSGSHLQSPFYISHVLPMRMKALLLLDLLLSFLEHVIQSVKIDHLTAAGWGLQASVK